MGIRKIIQRILLQCPTINTTEKKQNESWFDFIQLNLQTGPLYFIPHHLRQKIPLVQQNNALTFFYLLDRVLQRNKPTEKQPTILLTNIRITLHYYDSDWREWRRLQLDEQLHKFQKYAQKSEYEPSIKTFGELQAWICGQLQFGNDFHFSFRYDVFDNFHSSYRQTVTWLPTKLRYEENAYGLKTISCSELDVLAEGDEE